MELASLSPAGAPSVEGEKAKIAGKGERREKWTIGGTRRKTGIPRAPRLSSSRPGFECLLFTSPYFPARTKRRLKWPLWRIEGLALFASRSETWKSETYRNFILAPESLIPSISFPTQRSKPLRVRSSRGSGTGSDVGFCVWPLWTLSLQCGQTQIPTPLPVLAASYFIRVGSESP